MVASLPPAQVYTYYLAVARGRRPMYTNVHVVESTVESALCLFSAMGGALTIKRAEGYLLFPSFHKCV